MLPLSLTLVLPTLLRRNANISNREGEGLPYTLETRLFLERKKPPRPLWAVLDSHNHHFPTELCRESLSVFQQSRQGPIPV